MAKAQGSPASGWLESFFHLSERKTSVQTEVMAGLTTFMTMSYIVFVNPSILADAGVPRIAATTATALAAAIMCIAMGLFTNYPFALASGMGLNAFLAYSVILGGNLPWQTGMTIILIEGLIVTLLVLTNVREYVMNAIPIDLKRAIGAGIGLFIALIGLLNGKLVVINTVSGLPQLGNLADRATLLAAIGLVITGILMAANVRGGILLGIVATALIGVPMRITQIPTSIVSFNLDLSTVGAALSPTAFSALSWSAAGIVFALMLTDFFDTMGTVISVGGQAGFVTKDGKLPGLHRVLLVDSLAAAVGGLFGVSSVTTYVESASGVSVGGRTGLTSVVAGILFLLTLAFVPIVGVVPSAATAPALIVVGFLMMSVAKEIDWNETSAALPAFITLVGIPFTYSIADGIGLGILSYVLINLCCGRPKQVHPLLYAVALLFVLHFAF